MLGMGGKEGRIEGEREREREREREIGIGDKGWEGGLTQRDLRLRQ